MSRLGIAICLALMIVGPGIGLNVLAHWTYEIVEGGGQISDSPTWPCYGGNELSTGMGSGPRISTNGKFLFYVHDDDPSADDHTEVEIQFTAGVLDSDWRSHLSQASDVDENL